MSFQRQLQRHVDIIWNAADIIGRDVIPGTPSSGHRRPRQARQWVNTIEETLRQVPAAEGFVGLSVIEAGTGHVLAFVGPSPPDGDPTGSPAEDPTGSPADGGPAEPTGDGPGDPVPEALASAATDVVRTIAAFVATHATDEDLQDLVITTTGRHHLVRLVPGFAGVDDAFLLLTLDRSHSNLALARHLLLTFEADLVA